MIYINRERPDKNGHKIEPPEAWFDSARRHTKQAITDVKKGRKLKFSDHYSHDHCRAALEELFHRKCAYCESPLEETDWDVEHFRPKGECAASKRCDRPGHPGYYWLAYEWSNLYASCKPCNQSRRDKPTYYDSQTGPAQGKHDQFPLGDENTRAFSPEDSLEEEDRLLIDPCSDDPEEHLSFDVEGGIYATDDDPKGESTIQCMHLSRRRLVDKRREIIREVVEWYRLAQDAGNEGAVGTKVKLMNKIRDAEADSSKYAALARHIIKRPLKFGLEFDPHDS